MVTGLECEDGKNGSTEKASWGHSKGKIGKASEDVCGLVCFWIEENHDDEISRTEAYVLKSLSGRLIRRLVGTQSPPLLASHRSLSNVRGRRPPPHVTYCSLQTTCSPTIAVVKNLKPSPSPLSCTCMQRPVCELLRAAAHISAAASAAHAACAGQGVAGVAGKEMVQHCRRLQTPCYRALGRPLCLA